MSKPLIECVPNFSEGRDMNLIKQITDAIEEVEGVRLLHVDPGKATNRTVVTFAGEPLPVVEAAFRAIQKAAALIDMSKHQGEHPRMGATDVCPLVPISGISLEETADFARQLGKRVGEGLKIPVFLYEAAATVPERKSLATIRAGEYEGLEAKLRQADWKPDFGEAVFNPKSGATVIGARDFLIAYNVNLNTTSVRRANSVAFDVREQGRVLTGADGKPLKDAQGQPLRQAGACKSVKGLGWYIDEYGIAQVSLNLTDIRSTPLHIVFEEVCKSAARRGLRVTGSELIGLTPKSVLVDAGKYFLKQQQRSVGVSEAELIRIAVKTLGLNELSPFDPQKRVIEYLLSSVDGAHLVGMNLREFVEETASESPAPGGGAVAAYVGALGAALATMVANLSAHKRGWEAQWELFSDIAAEGQALKEVLLSKVDEDTAAFKRVMAAMQLPKGTDVEKKVRKKAIQAATQMAIEVPLSTAECTSKSFDILRKVAEIGNPASVSDAGVGALCARAAVHGAILNVKINLAGFEDAVYKTNILNRIAILAVAADQAEAAIRTIVESKI